LEDEIEEYKDSIESQVESEASRRVTGVQKDADDRVAEMKVLVDSVEKRYDGMKHSVQMSDKKVNNLQEQVYMLTVESDNQLDLLR